MLKDACFHPKLVLGLKILISRNHAKQVFSLNETVINEDDDIEAPWRPVSYDHK
jgi:hypothetical protein